MKTFLIQQPSSGTKNIECVYGHLYLCIVCNRIIAFAQLHKTTQQNHSLMPYLVDIELHADKHMKKCIPDYEDSGDMIYKHYKLL